MSCDQPAGFRHGKDVYGETCGCEGMDVPSVDLGAIRAHMPPGVEPLTDHFDVLELQESLKDNPRQQAIVAFTLRASYEALRDGIVARTELDACSCMKDVRINVLENKLNASFTAQKRAFEPKIIECLKASKSWEAPESLWVELHAVTHDLFEDRSPRKYQYALVQDGYDRPAQTVYAQSVRWMARLAVALGLSPEEGELDPETVFNAFEAQQKAQGELEEKLLKLCNVDPADDITVLDGVQAIVDLAQVLSAENVRLRGELDAARGGDFVHRRQYVERLEETLLGIGRLLGHKTFPDRANTAAYTTYPTQMLNYCSRLLQAVRTRMNNINAKKGSK